MGCTSSLGTWSEEVLMLANSAQQATILVASFMLNCWLMVKLISCRFYVSIPKSSYLFISEW